MNRSEGFEFHQRNQQNKIKSEIINENKLEMNEKNDKDTKLKIISNKRDRIMIAQLNKIQKMK